MTSTTRKRGRKGIVLPASKAIPRQWLGEGARLLGLAERTQAARDWRAATIHLAGSLARMEGSL